MSLNFVYKEICGSCDSCVSYEKPDIIMGDDPSYSEIRGYLEYYQMDELLVHCARSKNISAFNKIKEFNSGNVPLWIEQLLESNY